MEKGLQEMQEINNNASVYFGLSLLVLLLLPTLSVASKEIPELDTPGDKGPAFEYKLEGRPDPFAPFITDKTTSQQTGTDEIIDEKIELTGMRQFEPGQLTLVAIMSAGSGQLAMVEDVTGRGYVLKEGMAIGRRGVISRIENGQVQVTETAHTRSGKKIETQIVMRLKKEGDN